MEGSKTITTEIISLVNTWEIHLKQLPENVITERRNNQERNIKQILGHLIDSTSNNLHRIIHLQYRESPLSFPNYATFGNNDRWIAIQNYEQEDWHVMIQLWKYSLLHICHVIENVNDEKLDHEWIAGPGRNITLGEMIIDFPRHLRLHLAEIEELINNNDPNID
jgi:hypothetical protein